MKMKALVFAAAFFLTIAGPVQAQTDEFRVGQQVIGDINAPSTPTGLSATPVASSQIDLSWNASTDDVALGGYQVFRDSVQIATTSLTSYSDTGLIASTTYSYFVAAFDSSYNYSSSSTAVATTTPGVSAPPPSSDGGGTHLYLVDFNIVPEIYSTEVSWETSLYAQFELHWGRTTSYELGFVANGPFKREHKTVITDLEPATVYEYQLLGYDRQGKRHVLSSGTFKTLSAPDTIPPSNVFGLQASVTENDVVLTWQNPQDPDFAFVRIVRSHLFYPADPYDGFIAFQDEKTEFTDNDALKKYPVLYYTVFSYDTQGNISSGAVVAVSLDNLPETDAEPSEPFLLSFEDLEVIQQDVIQEDGELDADLPVLLRIAYEKLPEHLKTITVSLVHPRDPRLSFSFLLRINKDKTYYEARLAPMRVVGQYPVTVTVYDHEAQKMHQVKGSYHFTRSGSGVAGTIDRISFDIGYVAWALIALLLLLLAFVIGRRFMRKQVWVAAFKVFSVLVFCTGLVCVSLIFMEGNMQQAAVSAGSSGFFMHPYFLVCAACAGIVTLLVLFALKK